MGLTTLWTVLFGLSLVSSAKLLGSSECTYGPAFWCGSLRNAKQCSAVTHCIQSVWENQQLPEDNDDICGICKRMVQEARDTLESNQTQEELKQVLEGSCRLIPLREISDECVELADQFIPELIETLASQMNPQIVCATAGLCNSVRIDRMLREHGLLRSTKPQQAVADAANIANSDCDDCRTFITDVINEVRSHSKQEVMDRLLQICGVLGSVSDGCSGLVSVNIDVIYDFLLNLRPDDTCQLFGMCGDLFGGIVEAKNAVAKTGDEACDFCVVIAQHWKDVLTTNTSEEEFRQVLEGICGQTGSFKGECLGLVDNYGLAAYNWLLNEFNPKQVCEVVGICGNKEEKAVWTVLHVDPVPADTMLSENSFDKTSLTFVGEDEANSYRHAADSAAELPRVQLTPSIKISVAGESGRLPGGKQACTMCEFTLHFIQVQLQDQHTKQEIEDAVKYVCRRLPQDVREQCDDYVDAYGDQVIALLQQEIDPSVVCPMLGLCPGANIALPLPDTPQPRADVTCVACEFIMVKVKQILENKTDQESVRVALDKVCGLLPRSLADQCQTFVDENAIEVMQLLAGGVQPEQVCRMLGLCSRPAVALPALDASHQLPISRLFVPSSLPQEGSNSLENGGQSKVCVLCEFALSMLEKIIVDDEKNITLRIETQVERMCLLLPSTLQEDCLGFVEQYGQALVQLLINEIEPSVACRQLHLCKQPSFLIPTPRSTVKRSIVKRSVVDDEHRCLICKAVSNVDTSGPEDEVRLFCEKLASEHQQTCLDVNVDQLTTALAGGSSSTAACASIGYCPPPTQLIGSEKCTWGPAYWCQSLLHAQSCGATPHCEDRVWAGAAPAN